MSIERWSVLLASSAAGSSVEVVVVVACFGVDFWGVGIAAPPSAIFCLNWCRMCRSYSLDRRRKNSSDMTSRMTPIQEPANMPWEVMRHDLEMKPFEQSVSQSVSQ